MRARATDAHLVRRHERAVERRSPLSLASCGETHDVESTFNGDVFDIRGAFAATNSIVRRAKGNPVRIPEPGAEPLPSVRGP